MCGRSRTVPAVTARSGNSSRKAVVVLPVDRAAVAVEQAGAGQHVGAGAQARRAGRRGVARRAQLGHRDRGVEASARRRPRRPPRRARRRLSVVGAVGRERDPVRGRPPAGRRSSGCASDRPALPSARLASRSGSIGRREGDHRERGDEQKDDVAESDFGAPRRRTVARDALAGPFQGCRPVPLQGDVLHPSEFAAARPGRQTAGSLGRRPPAFARRVGAMPSTNPARTNQGPFTGRATVLWEIRRLAPSSRPSATAGEWRKGARRPGVHR